MKIEKIKIDEYKVFKNFEINFLDSENKPLDLVVLAGINGSGKTTLLDFILAKSFNNTNLNGTLSLDATDFYFNNINLGKQSVGNLPLTLINKYEGKNLSKVQSLLKKHFIYVKAQEQKVQDIKKEILKYIDTLIFEEELSAQEAYKRLRKKLNLIFEGLNIQVNFSGLNRDKNIFFKNNLGEKISIDDLSTGEKELLSKIFYLYISDIKNSIILIDEPEISLHPSWQNRIVKIYKNFAKQNNNQIIIATHSPQIVASTPNESLRILVKEDNIIKVISPNAYGMNVNKALTDIMGVNELRDIEVQTQYDKVKNMIHTNQYNLNDFESEFDILEEMMQNDSIDFGLLKLELLKRKQNASSK